MPYDALGNYIPGDEEPSLDQMRLALTKTQRPLDSATQTLKQVATEFNPLMATRTLQDVPRVAYNAVIAPLASTWGGLLGNLQATGAAKAFGALGMQKEAEEAQGRVREVTPTNYQAPLQSQSGEQFQEALGKAFEASKAPHMWPLTPANPNVRPFITPNDVRVMGAEATRVGRQVRDIPTDYFNAQSGFTRIDPVTNQPTLGVRLQGAAEDVGRIVEQRRAAGQTPIPGVPGALTPETRTYAVRPAGTTLTTPQGMPKGMESSELPTGTGVLRVLEDTIGPMGSKMTLDDVTGQLQWMRDHATGIDQRAFGAFQKRKAMELYPDAPTPDDAFEALITATPPADRKLLTLKHYDEFRQTPEGIAAGFGQLPSSTELMQRDEAARSWLQGPFVNYFKKHFGAVNDPLVRLASEGVTYTPSHAIEPLDVDLELNTVKERRAAAGLPVEGTVAPALHTAQAKLSEAEAKVSELNASRERYRDIAMQQGLQDPAQLPEYAATTNQITRAVAERDKLQEQVQNLELGKLYEDRADVAVQPRTPESILKGMDYRIKQFYPSVTRAQPGETLYTMRGANVLRDLGYHDFATEFYNKVLEGEIPVEKLKNLTVEKAVKQLAEPRIAKEKVAAKAALTYKTDAETVMKNTMQTYAKPENYFGNVGAIELTKDMGLDAPTMTRILSEDTTVLDHCIATGGSGGDKKNPWFPGKRRNHDAIYNIVTGEKNPNAGRETSSYVNSILAGDVMTSFRDANTGVPVATFQLHRSHIGQDGQQKYSIGFASGHQNGAVSPTYIDGIKDYLNANESMFAGTGGYLSEHLGIYDTQDLSTIRKDLSLKRNDMDVVDWQSLPRFVTDKEIKATIQASKDMQGAAQQTPAVARPEPGGPLQADTPLPQALRSDIESAYLNALETVETTGDDATLQSEASERLAQVLEHFMDSRLGDGATLGNLEQLFGDLRASAATYRDNRGELGQLVADGINEFITDLEGIRSAAERGHYTPAQAPTAQAPAAQAPRFTSDDFDAFVADIRQNVDGLIAHEITYISNIAADAMGTNVRGALENQPTEFAQRLADQAELADSAMLEQALNDLADRIAPRVPEAPLPELFFEPDAGHPANAPALNVQDMAFELFQDTRRGEGRDLNELQTTLQALETGNFDDMRFRALPADQRDRAQRDVAHQIRAIMDDLNITLPAEEQPTQVQRVILEDLERTLQNADILSLNAQLLGMTGGGSQIRPNPYWSELSPEQFQTALTRTRNRMRELEQQPRQQQQIAPFRPLTEPATEMTYNQLRDALDPQSQGEVAALHDDIARSNYTPDEIRRIAQMVYDHQMSQWERFDEMQRAMLYMDLLSTANRMEADLQRRGPFQPGGASAVRGLPLGNLNLQPAITAEMLRGPDTQPVRNFVQQVQSLPGVTQEGLRTGLMAFEQMDPTRQMTKAEFVRELLPSSYDIVDLRGASQDNQHLMDAAQDAFDQDASPVGDALGLKGAQLAAWANAVRTQYNDYDSFPANVKRALAKQGIEDADEYVEAYDIAYRDALETYVANYAGSLADEDGYTYANTQRLVQPSMGDQYGEFGVTHPDQRGTYHHFDLAPQGVIGHFRGTYNPADPIMLNTEHWVPSSQSRNPVKQTFETKPNSYVIEEIQSDAQKTAQQTGHLHQVHGVLFKAAIQKALELGADTVYLPTARIIADTRSEEHYTPNGEYIPLDRVTKKFAPIYDQAIVKEGLKPLLKIPGVTSKMVNGYHEISFTPEAIERILHGQGQSVPGYVKGGHVRGYQAGGRVEYPPFYRASNQAITRAQEMYPRAEGQDDQVDAARHMLASGYMTQSFGPTIAKGLGYLHEFKEAPLRTAGYALGISKPRYDYAMDVHNNMLGVELAQKAKDRADFERLVRESIAKGAAQTLTPEQAKVGREALKYANGGTVPQTPSLDKMKLELLMRSK